MQVHVGERQGKALALAQGGSVEGHQDGPKRVRFHLDPLLLVFGRSVKQALQFIVRIDVRYEALGLFRNYRRQWRYGDVSTARGVTVKATQDRQLLMPAACDWPATIEKGL